ncbi:MAG: toprim domain-containing protein [Rhizobiaceae bacterium]|nr:toprim domain-containing protein [Rhizobiaceae bacterium]
MTDREGSDEVVYRGPCDDCGSEDNLVTYADGHRFCYTPECGMKTPDENFSPNKVAKSKTKRGLIAYSEGDFTALNKRGLEEKTLRKFGYFRYRSESGKVIQVAPYYSQEGELVLQKTRDPEKNFPVLKSDNAPPLSDCMLFGQPVWGDKYDRMVVITEGELDALSVAQATDFKIPVVSLSAGVGSATKCLKKNYRWIDRFETIVLWFDDDSPGQEAVKECAPMFPVGKVKVAKVPGFKDASDLLQEGRKGDIYTAVWSAMGWRPQGIINAALCVEDMEEDDPELICEWPYPKVNEILGGIREGEVTYLVAGTGVGKTTIINETVYPIITSGKKIGVMRFEDTRRKSQLDLMSVHLNKRLHVDVVSKEERRRVHKELFESGMLELFDPTSAEWGFEAVKSYFRFMVRALDCRIVIADPLSFIVAQMDHNDERKALDKISVDLAAMAKELSASIIISHHLKRPEGRSHEEGGQTSLSQIRGSGGIANFANSVIGFERNQQGETSNLTRVRVLKNRDRGGTGVADILEFNPDTGRLLPTNKPFEEGPSEFGEY